MIESEAGSATGDRLIDFWQLHRQLAKLGAVPNLRNRERQIALDGYFRARRLGEGLSLHCVDAVECVNTRSTGQCPSGISLNILLAGEVHFCLGAERYCCDASGKGQALLIALAHDEPFTRILQAGQKVIKVNVSAGSTWLEARLGRDGAERLLTGDVRHWPADAALQTRARRLLALSDRCDAQSALALEATAIDLLCRCLDFGPAEPLIPQSTPDRPDSLLAQVRSALEHSSDLAGIAATVGMSVSTLQRRFKQRHGLTVMEFARRHQLERARQALLSDGASVQEAAYIAGYDHASNFVSAFKRQFSVTPAALVRLHLQ